MEVVFLLLHMIVGILALFVQLYQINELGGHVSFVYQFIFSNPVLHRCCFDSSLHRLQGYHTSSMEYDVPQEVDERLHMESGMEDKLRLVRTREVAATPLPRPRRRATVVYSKSTRLLI